MRYLLTMLIAASSLALSTQPATAQSAKPLIDSQNYVFQAQTAEPLRGNTHILTTVYTLQVTKDKIICDLPYFGREYMVLTDPAQNVLDFTSDKFGYTVTPRKKDGWKVVIKPRNSRDLEQLQLTISSDGYTTVQAYFNGRDPIYFYGKIQAPNKH